MKTVRRGAFIRLKSSTKMYNHGGRQPDSIATLIASDEPLRREGISAVLRQCAPVEIVAECPDGKALLHHTEVLHPALIVLDFEIPGCDPVDLTTRIRERSDAKILIVVGVEDQNIIYNVVKAGANGYLLRKCSGLELRLAIVDVLRGRLYIQGSSEPGNPEAFPDGINSGAPCEMELPGPGGGLAQMIEDAIIQRFRVMASQLETRLEETQRQSIRSCFDSAQNMIDLRIAALAKDIARNGEALAELRTAPAENQTDSAVQKPVGPQSIKSA